MKSWEEIENVLDESKDYKVADVMKRLARDDKEKVYQSIDN